MSNFLPKLCGPTFFSLIVANKKKDISDPSLMQNFLSIFQNTYKPDESTVKSTTSQYRNCNLTGSSSWIEFHNTNYINKINHEYETEYYVLLKNINTFLIDNIIDKASIILLGKQILELIINDDSISNEQVFKIKSNKEEISKSELLNLNRYKIDSLFLGVWMYILNNRKDDSIGKKTIDNWFESKGSYTRKEFVSNIGYNQCENYIIQIETESPTSKKEPIIEDDDKDYNFTSYLDAIYTHYSQVKTILYEYQPHDFHTIFECNDISTCEYNSKCNSYARIDNSSHLKIYKIIGNNKLLLTGTGGIGKSMMMKNLLFKSISDYKLSISNLIPIFVTLRDYNNSFYSFELFIYKYISYFDDISYEKFLEKLSNGKFLLLFDGLDEIKKQYLDFFFEELKKFSIKYNSNFITISSRPFDTFISLSTYSKLDICPLTKTQATNLIKKLDFRPDSPEIKENFIKNLDSKLYDEKTEFASNPLLLTIMLMTYEEIAEIPEKMHIFYQEAFIALAKRHDATKGAYKRTLNTKLSIEDLEYYICEFCARTYNDELFTFSRERIKDYLNSIKESIKKKEKNISTDFTVDDFINDLMINLCLLYFENNEYQFIHRSFQEYFTALYFSHKPDEYMLQLIDYFNDGAHRGASDMVFEMLYNMNPEKIEEYLFLPYLESILPSDDKTYIDYLNRIYPTIYYTNCESKSDKLNKSESFFYEYICRKVLKINHPILKNFKYYSNNVIFTFKKNNIVIGTEHRLFTSKLISDFQKYRELFEQLKINNDIVKELEQITKYTQKLKERKERKSKNLFD